MALQGFRSPTGGVLGLGGQVKPDDLRRELGITLRDLQAKSTLAAYKNPTQAWEDTKEDRERIEGRATLAFANARAEADKVGLPLEQAIAYARERAVEQYNADMALFYIAHPYASPERMITLAGGHPASGTAKAQAKIEA